jgi:hypothetical protein
VVLLPSSQGMFSGSDEGVGSARRPASLAGSVGGGDAGWASGREEREGSPSGRAKTGRIADVGSSFFSPEYIMKQEEEEPPRPRSRQR